MKKIVLFVLIMSCYWINTSNQSFIGYTWSPKTVKKCLRDTSVIFVLTPQGTFIGSGVLISKDGKVLTAAHMFNPTNYTSIEMILPGGNQYKMQTLLVNHRDDLALVQPIASAQNFDYAKIQESDNLEVGQDILVIGHPYEEYWTVTSGIISRLRWEFDYFCTIADITATVRPGNSGGPMFNIDGELIGIISAMRLTPLREPTGIGVAIPVKEIHSFLRTWELVKDKPTQIKRYQIGDIK